jgi:hypothetical protein
VPLYITNHIDLNSPQSNLIDAIMTIEHIQAPITPKQAVLENRDDWGNFQPFYDWPSIWPVVLREIGNGSSLITAIKKEGYPTYDAFQRHLRAHPEIKRMYEEAIEVRADYLAESLIDISEEPPPEGLDGPQLSAWINQMKIRIDTRKWTAAKLRPKQWGERMDVNVTQTQISITTALKDAEARLIDNVSDIEVNPPKNDRIS